MFSLVFYSCLKLANGGLECYADELQVFQGSNFCAEELTLMIPHLPKNESFVYSLACEQAYD